MKKYYFIISFAYGDIYDVYFEQVKQLKNAEFRSLRIEKGIAHYIEKLLFSNKTYYLFPARFRKSWLKRKIMNIIENLKTTNAQDICFVLPLNYFRYNGYGITEAIRECSSSAKVVYFFTDLISIIPERERCATTLGEADLMYSYDYNEAQKYNLKYHAVPYSDISYLGRSETCKHDICFIGQAKNRLDKIIRVYEYLTDNGIDCDFYITGVAPKSQKYADKIHYCNYFSYKDCLKITARSKCILEITQNNSTGHTPRVPEAIIMNKRLLSNNDYLVKDDYYCAENMRVFHDIEDIDIGFIKNPSSVEYKIDKALLSPQQFLENIESELNLMEE